MPLDFYFSLNIRQKVVLVLTLGLLAVVSIGGTSYRYVLEIERKHHISGIADDLSNTILEIRRYEKNLLLYSSQEDLEENQRYLIEAREIINRIAPALTTPPLTRILSRLNTEMEAYATDMTTIAGCLEKQLSECPGAEDNIRERGKSLVKLTHELAAVERQNIFLIINALKTHLLYSLFIFFILGGFLVFMTGRKIVRPLKIIENATLSIASGTFDRVHPPKGLRDETSRVLEAFNRMITELEKHQGQLVQAQKLSSIGIMAAGIAHQLNNPLNNISTSCQIVLEELPGADPEFIGRMLENSELEIMRAREIVRGLLEFSRAKEFAIRPSPLSPRISQALRLVSGQVPAGIRIHTDIEEITLPMDGREMQEVLINLIINAIQAIPDGVGDIFLSGRILPHSNMVEIRVEDTGTGIPEADFSKIFDPFFTTKKSGSGTGLGLSIAYGIVKQHQGSIKATNRPEGGTSISIRLPLNQEREECS
ncbi:two-component sensor histidine kinase [Desulfoluna limicola]|uniref:histidine kinase n=1 Tax=Desulfoluna limicola TaxID=2810562 RepID=A0ABM7PCL7_9BACT|nr:HAMP domain-containing sensor histidine kinase [Desulfoluna limicola]BCS95278.1 two-component sensor histidine kinase [Desulfoluna limicola]